MSTVSLALLLFAAALLSSAITCLAIWLYFKKVIEPGLQPQVDSFVSTLGDTVERKVRKGVVAGVTDLAGADTIKRTTGKVATTGASLMGEGLNLLLGGKPRRDTRDDQ